MTLEFLMKNIFNEPISSFHCEDLNSIALAKFNVACPLALPFSLPIIDIKELEINREQIFPDKFPDQETIKTAVLICSGDLEDANKVLTVNDILIKLKDMNESNHFCINIKNSDSFNYVINAINGTNDSECDRQNMPDNYKGSVTDFIV